MATNLPDPTQAELSKFRADELNRIHRELIVVIREAGPGSQVGALAGAVCELVNLVAEITTPAPAV